MDYGGSCNCSSCLSSHCRAASTNRESPESRKASAIAYQPCSFMATTSAATESGSFLSRKYLYAAATTSNSPCRNALVNASPASEVVNCARADAACHLTRFVPEVKAITNGSTARVSPMLPSESTAATRTPSSLSLLSFITAIKGSTASTLPSFPSESAAFPAGIHFSQCELYQWFHIAPGTIQIALGRQHYDPLLTLPSALAVCLNFISLQT